MKLLFSAVNVKNLQFRNNNKTSPNPIYYQFDSATNLEAAPDHFIGKGRNKQSKPLSIYFPSKTDLTSGEDFVLLHAKNWQGNKILINAYKQPNGIIPGLELES